ncbi:biofilm development protein YmgB/AriR [Enterobacter sp. BIGb0383]|uniref:biofilm development regulator YmgB/AriR family protein n=1 Tax=unclassified Enterobacter TaxID=2608935 RepID=UPI000F47C7E6|nr:MULTISPECIES: biofilm development regulator YmgB/AriR family protein [unclassified Enterobacter]ROP61793.1 biofilm development protein YmgB/AriR [Enterobacter sp. BIGb0383]ROS11954.1 biofilm development protein YmgB/AriR [Enterobacter sp. BIGb0359]
MTQTTLKTAQTTINLPDSALTDYFRSAGDLLTEEQAILGAAIRKLMASGRPLTNKEIILRLIDEIEITDDVVRIDIIRKTLEIVVDHTLDDI